MSLICPSISASSSLTADIGSISSMRCTKTTMPLLQIHENNFSKCRTRIDSLRLDPDWIRKSNHLVIVTFNKNNRISMSKLQRTNRNTKPVGGFFSDLGPMSMFKIDNEEIRNQNHEHKLQFFFPYFFSDIFLGNFLALFLPLIWLEGTKMRDLKNCVTENHWAPPRRRLSVERTHVTWDVGLVTSLDPTANTLTLAYLIIWLKMKINIGVPINIMMII